MYYATITRNGVVDQVFKKAPKIESSFDLHLVGGIDNIISEVITRRGFRKFDKKKLHRTSKT